jgi:hypothetical protein
MLKLGAPSCLLAVLLASPFSPGAAALFHRRNHLGEEHLAQLEVARLKVLTV